MNIVVLVDYSDKKFNKDFEIANVLLKEHNVFLVINDRQLSDLYGKCDLLIRGLSAQTNPLVSYEYYDLNENTYLDDIKMFNVGK